MPIRARSNKTSKRWSASAAFGDLEGDGDLDLFIGESSGQLKFYENTGDRSSPEFTLVSDDYLDIDVGRRSLPSLYDIDSDGDLDLVIGSESGGVLLFRNDGTPATARFVEAGPLPLPAFGFAAPAFSDFDGDGDDDVILGGQRGGLWYYENR